MNSKFLGAGCAVALAVLGGAASAATVDCPANIADNVTGALDCEYSLTADQDFLNKNPITVNAEAFFGITNWTFLKKDESSTGSGLSGTFNVSAYTGTYNTIMAIFKDGADTTLVGYILGAASGSWTSPFENPPFAVKETKDVSHISFYGTNTDTPPVPLPAAGWLLLAGVGGLAALRKRKAA